MIITVFRSRVRADAEAHAAEAERISRRMLELATSMPGFIAYKDFVAEDGESVTIVEWESLETLEG